MIKKIILTILSFATFCMLAESALALVQMNDSWRPDSLSTIEVEGATTNGNSETIATNTIIMFVGSIVSKILIFAASVAIIFLIISGANYIIAFGKDQRIEAGKRGMVWSLIGLILILLSYAIVQGVISVLLKMDASA